MMRVQPSWKIAVGVFVAYSCLIFAVWHLVGADYRDLVSERVALKSLVVPLALGSLVIAAAVTALGWWRPVMAERIDARPNWALWVVFAAMLLLFATQTITLERAKLSGHHLLVLATAGVLVGFNEEVAARGLLVVGFRAGGRSEAWVWFWSLLLFGGMHVANILSGLVWYGGLIQGMFAFLTGTGFYVLRRTTGTLLSSIVAHAIWDFLSFGMEASATGPGWSLAVLPATFLASLVAVIAVLRQDTQRKLDDGANGTPV